ncbi:hypothetical protein KSC_029390 [Ktedonobacter sp. SOSP1-52]|uniref:hypothetical protein n=1 Tax=Ktedonobacter sp. SOSP1-52 TaxID=2778366 RepID=UPI001915FB56|nr:hypothetical protein [Ktedonobacter sp. SOSP1-52]GHO64047.1 hypothetical protein KSC_029390 [Ktedonobacter sp. SOSP1-52]
MDEQKDPLYPFRLNNAPEVHEETQDEMDSEPTFVYGNPFEGPLPNVFDHDLDLKQMLFTQMKQEESKSSKTSAGNKKLAEDDRE